MVKWLTEDAEIGKIYRGKVVTIKEFGAFVEFLPGKEGLVHVSQLDTKRVEKPSDVVKVGDQFDVKIIDQDDQGRYKLSRKVLMKDSAQQPEGHHGEHEGEGKEGHRHGTHHGEGKDGHKHGR